MAEDIAYSDGVWKRIAAMTVFRLTVIASCNHKLEPPQAMDKEAKERVQKKIAYLESLVATLRRLVQFDKKLGFSRGSPICRTGEGEGRCVQVCTAPSWAKAFGKAITEVLDELTPHGQSIAKNQFESWSRFLGMTSLVEMTMQVGPEARLATYTLEKVMKDWQQHAEGVDEAVADDAALYRRDAAVRCRGVSEHWASMAGRCVHTCANKHMMSIDSFFCIVTGPMPSTIAKKVTHL